MDMRHPMTPQALADALGATRAEIQAPKAREAVLRRALLEMRPNGPVTGLRYEVTVRECRRRVLDRDRLPTAILDDDRFWKIGVSPTVVTRACGPARGTVREAALQPDAGGARKPAAAARHEVARAFPGEASGNPVLPPPQQSAFAFPGDDDDLVLIEEF